MALFGNKLEKAAWVHGVPWPSIRIGNRDVSADCLFVPCGTGIIAYYTPGHAYYCLPDYAEAADGQEHEARLLCNGSEYLYIKHDDGGQLIFLGEDVTPQSVMSVFEENMWIYAGDSGQYLLVSGWDEIVPVGFSAPETIDDSGPDLLVRAADDSFLYMHEGYSTEDALLTTIDNDIFVHSDTLSLDCAFRDALDLDAGEAVPACAVAGEDAVLYRNEGTCCLVWKGGREATDGTTKMYDDGGIIYVPSAGPGYFSLQAGTAPDEGDIAPAKLMISGSPAIALKYGDTIYVHVDGEYVTPRLEFGRKEDLLFAIDREKRTMYVFKDFFLEPEDTWQNGDTVRMEG